MVKLIGCMLVCLMTVGALGDVPPTVTDPASLQAEISQLTRENKALRAENQKLRQQLMNSSVKDPGSMQSAGAVQSGNSKEEAAGYWLSPSKKRHNSRCRYYKRSKGQPCGKDDGVPCKICGG